MYECRYNFWTEERFPNFKNSLEKLYSRVIDNYIDNEMSITARNSEDVRRDLLYFNEFFRDLEYYYISLIKLGIVNKCNFNNILDAFCNIKLVELFDPKDKDISAVTCDRVISINSKKKNNTKGLGTMAYNQMIFSHELGHIICGTWEDDAWDFADKLYKFGANKKILKNLKLGDRLYILEGLILLEEGIVQNCAEEVTHRLLKRRREAVQPKIDNEIFKGIEINSNFIFYEELQEIAVKFGKCLNFLECSDDDSFDLVLGKLAKKAFCRNFIDLLNDDICCDEDRVENFAIMLACMGKIKEASYAKFGVNKSISRDELEKYFRIFNLIADDNKCLRSEVNKQKVNA